MAYYLRECHPFTIRLAKLKSSSWGLPEGCDRCRTVGRRANNPRTEMIDLSFAHVVVSSRVAAVIDEIIFVFGRRSIGE